MSLKGAWQATRVVKSYTRPVGRSVPMAGESLSPLQVNKSHKIIMKLQYNFEVETPGKKE